jgi:MFS family permease
MTTFLDHPMRAQPTRALAVPFLGVLASLQLIDPSVANTFLVKAGQAFEMQGATLSLAACISTLAQAATVLLMGFLGDRLERRRMLMAALLLAIAGDGVALTAPDADLFLLGRAPGPTESQSQGRLHCLAGAAVLGWIAPLSCPSPRRLLI